MITKLEIKNFKGIRLLQLNNLSQVTLISGKNNIGKTSVLEAILLLFNSPLSSQIIPSLANRNFGLNPNLRFEQAISGIFNNNELSNNIVISTDNDKLEININNKPIFMKNNASGYPINSPEFNMLPTIKMDTSLLNSKYIRSGKPYFTSSIAKDPAQLNYFPFENNQIHVVKILPVIIVNECGELLRANDFVGIGLPDLRYLSIVREYENIRTNNRELIAKYLLPAIQLLDKEITAIEIGQDIQNSQAPRIDFIKQNRSLPLSTLGHGAKRIFNILLGIINTRDGILLIDEIENGIHYSLLSDLWNILFTMAKNCDCQVIATTHSWEAASYITNQPEENQKLFSFVNIARLRDGDLASATYNFEQFSYAIESNSELR